MSSDEDFLLESGLVPSAKLAQKGWEAAIRHTPDLFEYPIPKPPNEWTGREKVLDDISKDWEDFDHLVVGLIGFGGEGKTSIVRSWVHNRLLYEDSTLPKPEAIFYWDFYESRSIDRFFESATAYLGARDQLEEVKFAHERANLLAGMILTGRYLFILDGLEAVQYQDGEDYGLLQNPDLKDFLTYFASGEHESFCLITSRTPLIDLIDYITYIHRDVNRLKTKDGRELLRYFLENNGTNEQIDQVVEGWDGHALTLSLIGAYVRGVYDKDLSRVDITGLEDIQPLEISGDSQHKHYYNRVNQIVRSYNEYLTPQEREFLKVFSAFRIPVSRQALDQVLKADPEMVERLSHYRILRLDSKEEGYTAHPLIRQYYLDQLKNKPEEAKIVHRRIKEYFLSENSKTFKQNPSLQDLMPFIEAVHHLCEAGDYHEAYRILSELIDQDKNYVLTLQLGAYDTRLKLLSEFFPDGDMLKPPCGNQLEQYFVLKEIGFCLMALEQLEEARSFLERGIRVAEEMSDTNKLVHAYRDLSSVYVYLGELAQASNIIRKAANFDQDLTEPHQALNSLALESWIAYLQGNLEKAKRLFEKLEDEQCKLEPNQPYLYRSRGIFQADYLRRTGRIQDAKYVAEANLRISRNKRWLERESRCHRILGDIESESENDADARIHYSQALKIARSISHRPILIETLRAQGVFLTRQGELEEARNDLNEALSYATKGVYRINEANIHVGLGWLCLKEADQFPEKSKEKRSQAKAEAERSLQMSKEMGYYWGILDSEKVLEAI
ncbi:MAG: serine protease [Leptolyngbyaceae cyanobacterium RM1_406_9]|nr:serine protease [Leptolyngbyaceae cyanobacterium RM1_406_9]